MHFDLCLDVGFFSFKIRQELISLNLARIVKLM